MNTCVLAAAPAACIATPEENVSELVRQLGDKDLKTREAATEKLIGLGQAAVAEVSKAQNSPDFEVCLRVSRILRQIEVDPKALAAFRDEVAAFEGDTKGEKTLPGWEKFREQMGGDAASRKAFAKMSLAQRSLLRAFDGGTLNVDPLSASQLDQSLPVCIAALTKNENSEWLDSAMAILFIAASDLNAFSSQNQGELSQVIGNETFVKTLKEPAGELARKLFRNFLESAVNENNVASFQMVMSPLGKHGLKEETLALAKLFLQKKPATGAEPGMEVFTYVMALAALCQVGGPEQCALVEPLLDSELPVGEKAQVRDIALATLAHLSGQDSAEYGLKIKMVFETGPFELFGKLNEGAYNDSADRENQIAKWRDWSKANKPAGAPAAK